ncbi:hypothetical protein AAFF_G00368880 [Aldrovandia affinis]|uniref:Uncharacterized protein n=1 Tax=Aldrovandia affinis TaxID=143900 RepID=A0AAD7SH33_9TELE|nr:hypothetical protein AAFF_G00368880 [Aldrovandia affinis]
MWSVTAPRGARAGSCTRRAVGPRARARQLNPRGSRSVLEWMSAVHGAARSDSRLPALRLPLLGNTHFAYTSNLVICLSGTFKYPFKRTPAPKTAGRCDDHRQWMQLDAASSGR